MSFDATTQTYKGTGENPTPFHEARAEWDRRMGMTIVQARNWRMMAFMCMVLAIIFGLSLIYLTQQTRVVTYVVEIAETGQPSKIKLASDYYTPTKAQAAHFIGEMIEKVRSRPTDPVVLKHNVLEAYNFLAKDARHRMNEYVQGEQMFDPNTDRNAVTVEIANIIEKSETTFQIAWRETKFEKGQLVGTRTYTGLFTYEIIPPQTEEQVFKNPLGIYVSSFSWGLDQ